MSRHPAVSFFLKMSIRAEVTSYKSDPVAPARLRRNKNEMPYAVHQSLASCIFCEYSEIFRHQNAASTELNYFRNMGQFNDYVPSAAVWTPPDPRVSKSQLKFVNICIYLYM